ncbi:MAG: 3-dehydroquinate synthase [Granulosicoccus sp.]|nr:3-dehydroquinate synthase [Granulosicoccus sp.]
MKTVSIDLGQRSYPIHIGSGLIDIPGLISDSVRDRAMIVTNETVAPLYLDQVMASLGNKPAAHVILPDGEAHKNLAELDRIFSSLLMEHFDRRSTLIALGGGVIGDMTGFAAASYLRGVDFVQIPTTLLAQVDSSVGGKTGVNHQLGKNMIGAFHQPVAVIADMNTLDSLDDRELRAGLAEVIKYGFIIDESFFSWLEDNLDALLSRDAKATAYAVQRSCEIKARVVEADEHEFGQRAWLNLGHTFGHAIEAAVGYGQWLHGEAVGAGMAMALDLSRRLQFIDSAAHDRGISLIERCQLPTRPPDMMTPEIFRKYMARDKKVSDGQIQLILLENIGQAKHSATYDSNALQATLEDFTHR